MKTVIITGASGHLGKAVTSTFLNKGYRVIATIHKEQARKEMPAHKNLFLEVVDLINEVEATTFIENTITSYNKIDAALLLVGGFAMGRISETSGTDIRQQIALNFETAYFIARPLLQHMLKNDYGRLVFIGSRPALQAIDGKKYVAYALSKSLLLELAEIINEEAKGKNVVASVAVPSTLDTEPNRKSMPQSDPAKWVKPEAFAEILEFICNDASSPLRQPVWKIYNNA